jgi:hypothetical protein
MLCIPTTIKLLSLVLIMGIIEATGDMDYMIDHTVGEYQFGMSQVRFEQLNNQLSLTKEHGAYYVSITV